MEKDRKKKIITLLVIVFVTTLSIAFAALSRTLNINGTAKMDTATWDVHFENLSEARIIRDAVEINKPYVSDDGIMIYDMDVKLTKPKDEIIYTVEIVNSGSIDAEIDSIEVPTLTEEQEKLVDFIAVYNDGSSITEKDFLKAGESDLITISIKYSNDITEFDLPDAPLTINLTFKINYIQSDSLVNENSSKTEVVSVLTTQGFTEATGTFYRGPIAKNTVESIDFLSTMYVPEDVIGSWDASQSKNGKVVAWYQDVDKNGLYEVYIGGNGKVYAPTNCGHLFQNFNKLKTINFNGNFDTTNVTLMDSMFTGCTSLTTLDLSNFDTSKVTNMYGVFYGCSSLEILDVSFFNTSNVTTMAWLFRNCVNLTNIDVNDWNITNLVNMTGIFHNCQKLESINLSNWNTSNVTYMGGLFFCCYELTQLDLSNFNTSNVTDMSSMFSGLYNNSTMKLTNIDLSSFDTSKVTNMSYMFANCSVLTNIDLSNFNTSNVTNMNSMFYNTVILDLDLSSFDTSRVNNMEQMFRNSNINVLNLNGWDTSNVTNMWYMFAGCSIPIIDLSSFNTSNVTNIAGMFVHAFPTEVKFNKLDTTNVTEYHNIFFACSVRTFDISEVEASMYSNDAFKGIISSLGSGKTVYVLNEECVTLGQEINPNVTFVIKEA